MPLKNQLLAFAQPLLRELDTSGFSKHIREIDHACYRVTNLKSYERLKSELEETAELLSEAFINGRPIATFKLQNSIVINAATAISVIEVPAPKPNRDYAEGFEHLEAVIEGSLEEFITAHSQTKFDTSNLGAMINRDISLMLGTGLVKFHEHSLADVIDMEKSKLAKSTDKRMVVIDLDGTLAHMGEDMIPSGVQSLLSCLRSEGFAISVWTACGTNVAQDFLEQRGLSRFVDYVFAFDEVNLGKPTPAPTLLTLCRKHRSILVGDSQADLEGARRLGIPFLQAAWLHRASLPVREEDVCHSPLAALTAILKTLKTPVERL